MWRRCSSDSSSPPHRTNRSQPGLPESTDGRSGLSSPLLSPGNQARAAVAETGRDRPLCSHRARAGRDVGVIG